MLVRKGDKLLRLFPSPEPHRQRRRPQMPQNQLRMKRENLPRHDSSFIRHVCDISPSNKNTNHVRSNPRPGPGHPTTRMNNALHVERKPTCLARSGNRILHFVSTLAQSCLRLFLMLSPRGSRMRSATTTPRKCRNRAQNLSMDT